MTNNAEHEAQMRMGRGDWKDEMNEVDLWIENDDSEYQYTAASIWGVILAYGYEKSGDLACDIIAYAIKSIYSAAEARGFAAGIEATIEYFNTHAGTYTTNAEMHEYLRALNPAPQGKAK